MTLDGRQLDRLREDLIRRAHSQREADLERGAPQEMEETRQQGHRPGRLAGLRLFSRAAEIRSHPQPVAQDVEGPKTPVLVQEAPAHRFTLPRFSRFWASGGNGNGSGHDNGNGAGSPAQSEWPSAFPTHPALRSPAPPQPQQQQGQSWNLPVPPEPATLTSESTRAPSSYYSSTEGLTATTQDGSESREDRQRRRRRRQRRKHHHHHHNRTRGQYSHHHNNHHHGRHRSRRKKPPQRFLGCFPWVKSREMRTHIVRCFVCGLFLVCLLSVYLALSVTKNIKMGDFTIVLIVIICVATIIFCYGLVRLCILVIRRDREKTRQTRLAHDWTPPGVYAVPERPIRVMLASDEEAANGRDEGLKTTPPAYGVWRESVRVDPDRLYWQRSEQSSVPEIPAMPRTGPRPPSYASDDGVSYVVEAEPRSIAPSSTVDLPTHPSEVGRVAQSRPAW